MKVKTSRGEKIFQVFNYLFLSFFTIICLYPMWHIVMGSFSNSLELMSHSGLLLWPKGFSLAAYEKVFQNPMIYTGYLNTLLVLVVSMVLFMAMTALGAYFFSRKGVYFKKPLMMLVMFTMFFSGGMIPFYLTLKDFNLIGTRWGVILPFMISTYNMIILRTAFESIPDSLTEAAQIDGAGHITILFKVILPLSKATLAVIALYYAVGIWNGWFWSSLLLRDRAKQPLQVVLREILLTSLDTGDTEGIATTIKYATTMVATIPILLVYPMLQKHFTKGVMIGAVKG